VNAWGGSPLSDFRTFSARSTSKGLRPGWNRATFIVRDETLQKPKAVGYWDRKELKRVAKEAFRA
jgi:hypothetical protein